MRCLSPLQHGSATVIVEVSTNGGADFSVSRVTFTYEAAVNVASITPPVGPTLGGTLVSIFGSHFSASLLLKCRFGWTEVAGAFVSSRQVNYEIEEPIENENLETPYQRYDDR